MFGNIRVLTILSVRRLRRQLAKSFNDAFPGQGFMSESKHMMTMPEGIGQCPGGFLGLDSLTHERPQSSHD